MDGKNEIAPIPKAQPTSLETQGEPEIGAHYFWSPADPNSTILPSSVTRTEDGKLQFVFQLPPTILQELQGSRQQVIQPGTRYLVEDSDFFRHITIEEIEERAQKGSPVKKVYWKSGTLPKPPNPAK